MLRPVRRSAIEQRFLHFATVFALIPCRRASVLEALLTMFVSLDGPPLSSWRSGVELAPQCLLPVSG